MSPLLPPAVLLTAAVVVLLTTPVVRSVLLRRSVLDVPGERSSHHTPTPRGGGVAIVLGLLTAFAVATGWQVSVPWAAVTTLVLLAGCGLVEDLRGVPIRVRFAVQLLAAVPLVLATMPLWAAPLGILFVAALVNATNFMDGINGISAFTVSVIGLADVVAGIRYDAEALVVLGAALCGAGLGFMPLNLRGKIFAGDVGSYALGAALAAGVLVGAYGGVPLWALLLPLSVYAADTAWTLGVRIGRGESWRQAHRQHVYQRLTDRGWSHRRSAATVAGTSALVAAPAVLLPQQWWMVALAWAAVCAAGYLALPEVLSRTDGPGRRRRTPTGAR